MKIRTFWDSEDIRKACIRNNWYTCGTCDRYAAMLEHVDGNEPTAETVYKVACDIWRNSELSDDYEMDEHIDNIAFVILNDCCTHCIEY